MKKTIGIVLIILFILILGIVLFTCFNKTENEEFTQNIFLKETSSNLEYQVINNEKELLNLLENQNYQNETCDCIEDYEIKLKDKTYFIYDLQESIHIRLDEKEAKLSKEDSDKLSNIIEETITN